jgi:rhamnose transport system ATP-binding protein
VPPLLAASSIRKSFAGVRALKGVSFALGAGEVHALVGENGAGKSTLIRIMTGAERADAGTLAIDGATVDLAHLTPARAHMSGIAVIYQQPALFPDLTVTENIALTLEPGTGWRPIDWRRRRRRAAELLARAGGGFDADRLAGSLSMPEQQLVEIARAIGASARVILMDEPTASLTDREVARLFEVVARLRRDGAGVLYISHRLEEVFAIADRVTVLRDGETVMTAPREGLSRDDVVRHMVGRTPGAGGGSSSRTGGSISNTGGSPLPAVPPAGDAVAPTMALDVRHLWSRAAGVHDVSLSVRQGEILGVAGLVGSGRTELAETLFGLHPIDRGDVRIGGARVAISGPEDAIRHGLAYVPEDRRRHGVVLDMTIAANTTLASLSVVSRRGLVAHDVERALAHRFVRELQIKAPTVDTEVAALSGGNQQKVALARWLATNPSVLMLDEPTQGVDVGAKAEIHAQMRALAARGLAILMISSELPEILAMSDRIVVMREGTIRATVDRADATAETLLALALADATPAAAHG